MSIIEVRTFHASCSLCPRKDPGAPNAYSLPDGWSRIFIESPELEIHIADEGAWGPVALDLCPDCTSRTRNSCDLIIQAQKESQK